MAIRDIREIPDPVLRTKCEPITEVTDGVPGLVTDLLDTVDQEGRAGLAANQIGVSLTAFSWHVEDEVGYVINPRLVELSEDSIEEEEGCLSVPGLWYPTSRSRYARVEGSDLDGNPVVVEGTGMLARCLQHEMDHLAGKLLLDRLERNVRARAMKDLRERL